MKTTIFTAFMLTVSSLVYGQTAKTKTFSWNNLPVISKPVFKKDTFNIVKYSAVADGIYLNTEAINNAINDCSKKGGGVVLIPAGLWLSGPIYLKSGVNLHLKQGAHLVFTTDKSKYKIVEGDYEGKSAARNESPINGKNLQNIAITGKGVIDGSGDVWRAVGQGPLTASQWKEKIASGGVLSDDGKTWYPSEQFKQAQVKGKSMLIQPGMDLSAFADMKDFLRPNLLVLKNCKKVLIEGITFQNSPAWCLHPLMCEDLTISGIRVKNPHYAQNGDGIDIESCTRFIVENSVLDVGDDAICIKSGKDEEGRKRGIPSAQGIIRGNLVYSGHGAVVIGSEMSGGANNIFIENCTFMGTDKGLRFKSTRGRGGVVENIYARNLTMKDILQEAIFFDMFYFVKFATDGKRDETPVVNEGTPIFRNMVFDNIICNGAKIAVFIRGLSEMNVQNITLSNSTIAADKGVELTDATQIKFDNVRFVVKNQVPVFSLTGSKDISINKVQYNNGLPSLLQVNGVGNERIQVQGTDLKSTGKTLELKGGASESAVIYK
ncbi:glycoside hydrolase family 28 protein [Pedobacter frigiditerrae]|uniref:Glycoside hydrolase family 28 protein n=1 Tax=Pedobacter frigiditerrae TaxID=2530452 RepID=A0A4R0MT30_9SPHI|nr:glycoside hydrolase family 28 protein [Pedobacter frigiditerrae]TCC90199.1 glycoside hydrolase family 28 protein [Pedobacter frigiditerrae]